MNPSSKPASADWDFKDLLQVALSYRRLIVFITFLFAVAAVAYCLKAKPLYQSATTVRIPQATTASNNSLEDSYSMGGDQIETDIEICQSGNVAARVIKEMGLENTAGFKGASATAMVQSLVRMISVSNVLKSDLISIRAEAPNPQFAADLANAWGKCFIEAELDLAHQAAAARGDFLQDQVSKMKEKLANPALRFSDESQADQETYDRLLSNLRDARLAESNQNLGVVVVDKALPPDGPVKPQKRRIVQMALFLGLFFGFQLALLLDRLTDLLRSPDKLKRTSGLPEYAILPDFRDGTRLPNGTKGLIQDSVFQDSGYLEGFRELRTNLQYAQTGKPLETVSILSPGRDEGATLANANLALSMAQVGKKVLLVDADLRKPSLGTLFGIEPPKGMGLPAALAGRGPWKFMVVASGVANLDLLINETVVPNATELLSAESMNRFIEEAKKAYDYVVFDGAPILKLTDSLVLAALLDGVVLLARWGRTRSGEVAKAVEELSSVKAKALGTILNAVKSEKGIFRLVFPSRPGEWSPALSKEKKDAPLKKRFAPFKGVLGLFKWLLP